MGVVGHESALFSHFLSTLHQKRNTIVIVKEVVEFGSKRNTEMCEVVDPVVEWGVVSLDGEDVFAVALALGAGFEHGKSVGVEVDPATLVREEETHSASEHAPSGIPHSQTLFFVEHQVAGHPLHVECPLQPALGALLQVVLQQLSPLGTLHHLFDGGVSTGQRLVQSQVLQLVHIRHYFLVRLVVAVVERA
jgi:hypothetical protein